MKRENVFDIIKGLAIISVIIVHFPSEYRVFSIGLSYHVAAFFAVTGILVFNKQQKESTPLIKEVKKDAKKILYPYFSLSIIYLLVHSAIKIIAGDTKELFTYICDNAFLTISWIGIGTLWFFPVLFLAKLLFRYIVVRFQKFSFAIMFFLGGSACFVASILCRHEIEVEMNISLIGGLKNCVFFILETFIVLPIMVFGCVVWNIIKKYEYNKKQGIFLLLAILFQTVNVFLFNSCYSVNDLHYAKMINVFGYYICTFLGVAALMCFSIWLSRIKKISNMFSFFGRNSLIVMTTHLEYHVISVVLYVFLRVMSNEWIIRIGALLVVCLVEALICIIVNKTAIRGVFIYEQSILSQRNQKE